MRVLTVTELRRITKGQKYVIIMVIFVCGLLIYANVVAFNLISAPTFVNDIIAYATLTVAVTLTIIILRIVIRDKSKSNELTYTIPLAVSTKETVKISNKTPLPIILPANIDEKEKQPTHQLTMQPTKLICPACRKEFNIPTFWGDLIVDFGPPKQSNLIKNCPNCETPIPLKRKDVPEDIWKE